MKVIVTGASGFIGKKLVKELLSANLNCIAVSRKEPKFYCVADYREAPPGDVLVHLAEINNRSVANDLGFKYQIKTRDTLRALLDKGYQKVIYVSSAVLYGDEDLTPHRETDDINVLDTYTQIKSSSEDVVLSYGGMVARLSNVYGNGMSAGNVMSDIFDQIYSDGPVILKDMKPIRDFVWVDDVVDALKKMILTKKSGVFNVGSGVGTSVFDVAQLAIDYSGSSNKEIISLSASSRQLCNILNIEKMFDSFDWKPNVTLPHGIKRLLDLKKKTEV